MDLQSPADGLVVFGHDVVLLEGESTLQGARILVVNWELRPYKIQWWSSSVFVSIVKVTLL